MSKLCLKCNLKKETRQDVTHRIGPKRKNVKLRVDPASYGQSLLSIIYLTSMRTIERREKERERESMKRNYLRSIFVIGLHYIRLKKNMSIFFSQFFVGSYLDFVFSFSYSFLLLFILSHLWLATLTSFSYRMCVCVCDIYFTFFFS